MFATGPAPAIPELGINPYQWGTECLSGDVRAGDATSFPQPIGLVCKDDQHISSYCCVSCTLQAATFDYKLLYAFARAVSDEVRAKVSKWQV